MKKKRVFIFILALLGCLYAEAVTLKVGEAYHMQITHTPMMLGEQMSSISWSCSGSCVSHTGGGGSSYYYAVIARSEGYATVTCRYTIKNTRYNTSSSYTDSWSITVRANKPESVSITPSSVEIDVGHTASVSANISPYDAKYSYLSWSSSNSGIASVNYSGESATITGVAPGTTTVSATTDNGKTGYCNVKVWGTSPTAVSISGESGVYIGYTKQMTATFTPSDHHSTVTWSSDKTSVATVDQKGVVTGMGSGTAVITARTANGKSATKTITVTEPPFTLESTSPNNGATDVTVFQQPSATFSLTLYSGAQASGIKLYAGSESDKVDGKVNISGKTITFVPTRALKPFTKYTFLIPANGVKNQWGTDYNKEVRFSFTSGDVLPLTMTVSMAAGYVERGDELVLKASESDAEIRYTTDGSEPSENSTLYTSPIVINKEVTIWARAYKNGYATPEFKGTYKITHAHVTDKYPVDEQLYIYKDVNPYVVYEVNVKKGSQFGNLSVKREDGMIVNGKFILKEKRLVFVPNKGLELGHTYTVIVPEGAVVANDGEPNKAMQWNFTTGEFIRSISAGYQQAAAVRTDNTLWYWGKKINQYDGGDYTDQTLWLSPREIASDVSVASCGYTHNIFAKTNGQVWGWGLQFCGEVGTGSTLIVDPTMVSDESASLVVAGSQTSAILKNGTLKMAGRNDFGQVGDLANTAYSEYQNVALTNVRQVALGWQTIMALQKNSTLYGWGYNANDLLADGTKKDVYAPKQIMTGVDTFAISKWDNTNAAVVKNDGTLWTWGLNDHGQIGDGTIVQPEGPVQVMSKVNTIAIGNRFMAAIDSDGALWTWGDNSYGQLGDGTTTAVLQPHKIMEEVESIELGNNFAVALKVDGSVWTWGANDLSQLGNGGKSTYNATPQQIIPGRERKQAEGVQVMDATLQLGVGEQAVVCAKPVPLQADYHAWSWSTSNADVVTVDGRGVITAVSKGTAIITLTSDNGKTAQCTVTVGDSFIPGDVNSDGLVNVTDIVATVNYIMEKPSDNFNEAAADLNGDGYINVTDIVKMVSIIMSGDGGSSRRAAATSSKLIISGHNIQLRNAEDYIAAQFDINLSDGESISNVVFNGSSNHRLHWKMVDANTYRVVVYSMTNAAFRVNSDNLIDIFMNGSQKATIRNELLIKADGTTGIDAIRKDAEDGKVYDLNGRQVKNPRKGVYIINGKKVLVK